MAEDPVVRSGRREALFTFGLWLAAGIYTVSYCSLHAYHRAPGDIRYVLWFPDWMFWGVVAPWLTCAAISCTFAIFFMRDAPLASDADVIPDGLASEHAAAGKASPGGNPPDRQSPAGGSPATGDRP